jgi:hypothetical protein
LQILNFIIIIKSSTQVINKISKFQQKKNFKNQCQNCSCTICYFSDISENGMPTAASVPSFRSPHNFFGFFLKISIGYYRKEMQYRFFTLGTLGKALGYGLYWNRAHTWLHLMWALAPVKPLAALGLLYPTQNLCSVFTYTFGTVI